jgi:hypothetical protein
MIRGWNEMLATGKIQRYLLRQKQLKSKSRRAERVAAKTASPSGEGPGDGPPLKKLKSPVQLCPLHANS